MVYNISVRNTTTKKRKGKWKVSYYIGGYDSWKLRSYEGEKSRNLFVANCEGCHQNIESDETFYSNQYDETACSEHCAEKIIMRNAEAIILDRAIEVIAAGKEETSCEVCEKELTNIINIYNISWIDDYDFCSIGCCEKFVKKKPRYFIDLEFEEM